MSTEYKLSYTASEIDEKLKYIDTIMDSGGNADQSGLTTAQIDALHGMFKVCAFTKEDISAEYTAFKTAFGIEDSGEEEPDTPVEPDEPDEPVTPEVTLTSISATYSGGEVAVGTAVTALTGIVVTAHYSDGTSETVTGYTLSGEIAEGSNTVSVSYEGLTTSFTVTGVAEEEPEIPPAEIPADATRLAYIEATGTQYIDTGYQPAAMDTVELTMETTIPTKNAICMGVSDANKNAFAMGFNSTYLKWGRGQGALPATAGNVASVFNDGDSKKFVFRSLFGKEGWSGDRLLNYGKWYETDGTTQIANLTVSNEALCVYNDIAANMWLFKGNEQNNSWDDVSSMKLYECIFYAEDGTEKHHYVPVKDASGVVCLYDIVDKAYLYNAGTGDFIGGEVA